jgi:hypothetical protein
MVTGWVGFALLIATPVTYPRVLSKGAKTLLPDGVPMTVVSKSELPGVTSLKMAVTPIRPVLATSAQP